MGSAVAARSVTVVGFGAIAASVAYLAVSGGGLRYTADSADTVPLWHPWIPALVGAAVALMIRPADQPNTASHPRYQAWILLGCAAGFAAGLLILGTDEPVYLGLKVLLLAAVPVVMFVVSRTPDGDPSPSTRGSWWRPAVPVAAYVAAYLAIAPTRPPLLAGLSVVDALLVLLVGLAVNAVLEEFFYRRWLLDRWREILGPWPAIALSSVAFALWHVAIQGSGDPIRDAANALANQGVSGVFLGFLWIRFRMMWPLLVIHGIWNANPLNLF